MLRHELRRFCQTAGHDVLLRRKARLLPEEPAKITAVQAQPRGDIPVSYTHLDVYKRQGHADTTDPEILKVRARYAELEAAHKKVIAEEAAEVCAAGGLFIIGTERHESRRIDNQLRGRRCV